jgi:uncharacterized protein YciI
MKYVLRYESADDFTRERALELFAAHMARWSEFREDGTLLLIGPFENPADGALSVFTTREAAEAFATSDPFVLEGLVKHWTITGWNEALLEPL